MEKDKKIFCLVSNCGNYKISLYEREILCVNNNTYLYSKIILSGMFWDSAVCLNQGIQDAEIVDNFSICLSQVIIDIDDLGKFLSIINDEDNVIFVSPFEVYASSESNNIELSFKKYDDELIVDFGDSDFLCKYKYSRVNGEFKFITDQSCIRLARESLISWLKQIF